MRTKILAALFALSAAVASAQTPTPTPVPEDYMLTFSGIEAKSFDVGIDRYRMVGSCDALGLRDATVPGSKFTAKTITVSNANDRVTSVAHGLVTGMTIIISGHSGSTPAISGARTVTAIDADNFTVGIDITVAGSGGTFTTDCTLANGCLLKGAAGGAACTAAQARAVGLPIYPHTLAGRQAFAQDIWKPLQASDIVGHAVMWRKELLERKKDDTDCTGIGTVAGCP